ncbi:hypothetical protein [Haloprofundus salilacus]|uniref:hypothetical protein n=1 Tax=Haloprofundus salilacus TaxID=2876190 RepID=UPI001CCE5066|nr:hypothetical protein [Haloprofundus salilacus]
MSVPECELDSQRLLGAALLASGLIAVLVVTFGWSRLLLLDRSTAGAGKIILGVMTGWSLATAAYAPFLLAVLLVVAGSSRRAVVGGAVLVYVVDLLFIVGRTLLSDLPGELPLTIFAVPLGRVLTFLAVATAVWFAYHGGYERLVSAVGNVDQHPLFAIVAHEDIGPTLSLQRGLIATGLAAIVGAGGLVLVHGVGTFLQSVTRPETGGSSTRVFLQGSGLRVGVPLTELPVEWLFTASFLLGVIFLTGPRLRLRDFLKAIAVVFGVQSTVRLLPALIPPFRPIDLWATSGPVLAPLEDSILLFGIAVAVWMAFHDGLETLHHITRSRLVSD